MPLGLLPAPLSWLWLSESRGAVRRLDVAGTVLTGTGLFGLVLALIRGGSVSREQEGVASGVNNAIREFGGVLGIAVMGAVFTARGGYGPTARLSAGQHYVNGLVPAGYTGAAVVAVASLAMWLVPRAGARVRPAG